MEIIGKLAILFNQEHWKTIKLMKRSLDKILTETNKIDDLQILPKN